jgi:hypothetical protein
MVILSPISLVQGRDPLHLSVWQHLPGREVRLCGRRSGRDCPRVLLLHAGKKSERAATLLKLMPRIIPYCAIFIFCEIICTFLRARKRANYSANATCCFLLCRLFIFISTCSCPLVFLQPSPSVREKCLLKKCPSPYDLQA